MSDLQRKWVEALAHRRTQSLTSPSDVNSIPSMSQWGYNSLNVSLPVHRWTFLLYTWTEYLEQYRRKTSLHKLQKKQQEAGKTQTHASVSLQQLQHQRKDFVWVIVNRLWGVITDYPQCDSGGFSVCLSLYIKYQCSCYNGHHSWSVCL